jgi:hypothetical protein
MTKCCEADHSAVEIGIHWVCVYWYWNDGEVRDVPVTCGVDERLRQVVSRDIPLCQGQNPLPLQVQTLR